MILKARRSPDGYNGLLTVSLPPGSELLRIHWQSNAPVFFGPKPGHRPSNRFDAPAGEFRVLYAAEKLEGAFVETVLRRPRRLMRRREADDRAVTKLQLQRPLTLAKVMDEGLQWHSLDAGEIGVNDYAFSRRLALDLYNSFPHCDGLAYRSRYNNGQVCYALCDRVDETAFAQVGRMDFHDHREIIDQLMRFYGAAFDTSAKP